MAYRNYDLSFGSIESIFQNHKLSIGSKQKIKNVKFIILIGYITLTYSNGKSNCLWYASQLIRINTQLIISLLEHLFKLTKKKFRNFS